MNIGERIKKRRKELDLSVDDVALKLNKNRATIYRYESNDIENLPISILEPLATILQTTPTYLLGMEEKDTESNVPSSKEELLLMNYNKLNSIGKAEAFKRVNELTFIDMYTEKEHLLPLAAHFKEDVDVNSPTYKEDLQHDIDIMMNDDEWK